MDLGPTQPIRECPTCGVDAARAMVVAAVVAFYQPSYVCPRCGIESNTLQLAADHMSVHVESISEFVNTWITNMAESHRLRIIRE